MYTADVQHLLEIEHEFKIEHTEHVQDVPQLQSLLSDLGYLCVPYVTRWVQRTYLDTADDAFLKSGLSVSLNRDTAIRSITLKNLIEEKNCVGTFGESRFKGSNCEEMLRSSLFWALPATRHIVPQLDQAPTLSVRLAVFAHRRYFWVTPKNVAQLSTFTTYPIVMSFDDVYLSLDREDTTTCRITDIEFEAKPFHAASLSIIQELAGRLRNADLAPHCRSKYAMARARLAQ